MTNLALMQKMSQARLDFASRNIKKNGHNDYSKYDYFKLDDILNPILEICKTHNLFPMINFGHEEATLTVYDLENEGSYITFNCPYNIDCAVKGAQAIQNEGAKQTYVRRYLYMVAFEISEPDLVEINTEIQGNSDDAQKYRNSLIKELEKYGITVAMLMAYKGSMENVTTEYLERQVKRFKEKEAAQQGATNGQI